MRLGYAAPLGLTAALVAGVVPATASAGPDSAVAAAAAARHRTTIVPVRMTVSPSEHQRYGVGQLVTAHFSQPIVRKDDVENHITVTANRRMSVGAWGWIDDQTAVYRPKRFWPAYAKIAFKFRLRGLVVGRHGGTKYVGGRRANKTFVLHTARSFVLTVKDNKHRMYVTRNGSLMRTFPVSLGKPGYRTRSGIKILTGERYRVLRMTGTDRFTGETWDVLAPFSIRLTPSGEFIHGAPWAYGRMGRWNGSHGCTNMFVRDAKWLYYTTRAGDPVVTTGTGRRMETYNGTPGSYWNYRWRVWKRMSATYGSRHPAGALSLTAPVDDGP